jgi:hypothetical protein
METEAGVETAHGHDQSPVTSVFELRRPQAAHRRARIEVKDVDC